MTLYRNEMLVRLFLAFGLVGAASGATDDWTRTASIAPGSRVIVNMLSGAEHRGTFRSASADSVQLTVDGNELAMQRGDVVRVRLYTPSRRIRNVLIGAGIGVAAGIVAGFATCPSCVGELSSDDFHRRLGLGGLAGAGAGAGVGLLGSPYKTIYKRRK